MEESVPHIRERKDDLLSLVIEAPEVTDRNFLEVYEKILEIIAANRDASQISVYADNAYSKEEIRNILLNKDNVFICAKNRSNEIVGLAFTCLDTDYDTEREKTAYVYAVFLDRAYQGKKHVAPLMERLEHALKARRYVQMSIDAKDKKDAGGKSFADKIDGHYGNRVITKRPNDAHQREKYGPQKYFLIKI